MTDYVEELGKKQHEKIFYTDSQCFVQLVRNTVYHSKIRHRNRRLVEDGDVLGEDRGCKEFNKHVDKMC